MTPDQQTIHTFRAAVDAWLAVNDACTADLIARHEQHKARIADAAVRFDAFRDNAVGVDLGLVEGGVR